MKPILISIAFIICWSSGFVGSLLVGENASPIGLLAWRYIATAVLLAGVILLLRSAKHPAKARLLPALTRSAWKHQILMGVLSHTTFLGAVFWASDLAIDPGITSLVCALQPILVAAVGARLWGDPFNFRMAAGLVLGLVAVGLAAGSIDFSSTSVFGLLLPFVALLGLSASAVLERASDAQGSIVQALAIQTATAAVIFTGVALAMGDMGVHVNADFVWAMVWLVFLSGIGGYAAYTACLRTMGSTMTSLLLFVTPPVTSFWTWLMFQQPVNAGQIAGMVLGIVAVALTVNGERRERSNT